MRCPAATLAALLCLAQAGTAQASTYAVTVSEGVSSGQGFDTTNANPFGASNGSNNVASASFGFNGPLSFWDNAPQNGGAAGDLNSLFGFSASNVSNYTGLGTVTQNGGLVANYGTLASFLSSSGSAGGFQYASWYDFDLGTLAAGTILTVTHDDGISIYQGGTRLGSTVSGPTAQVTDRVVIGQSGDTRLYYSRQNGTPSILNVAIPEPESLLTFAGAFGGLAAGLHRRLPSRRRILAKWHRLSRR